MNIRELVREAVHVGVRFEIVAMAVVTLALAWDADPMAWVTLTSTAVTFGSLKL